MTVWRWRAFGVAFLLSAAAAVLIGVVETILALPRVPASVRELLYGADLHLVWALLCTFGLRILLWGRSEKTFPLIALGAFLAGELAVVPTYWLNLSSFWPPFYLTKGKIFSLASIGIGAGVGVLLAWLLGRLTAGEQWVRRTRGIMGAGGIALAVILAGLNLALLASAYPRGDRIDTRAEADELERPDVFFILIDTLRKDHLSFFGYNRPTSPNIDALLRESYVCTEAYTPSNWTTPSVASLFTGLYPSAHGMTSAAFRIPDNALMLAEHFRSYGYQTAAFVANQTIAGSNGFAQGFQSFYPPPAPWWSYHQRTAFENLPGRLTVPGHATLGRVINQQVLRWLGDHPEGPRFVYIHYLEPHSSYLPPPRDRDAVAPGVPDGPRMPPTLVAHEHEMNEEGCRDWECLDDPPTMTAQELAGMVANYDGDIHLVDRYLGSLLLELARGGTLDDAHLIFCNDHGEEFFDHRGWFHGGSIYEEMTGCPLGYRPPGGLEPGITIERPVNLLDVIPTLCARLGFDPPPLHQGLVIPEMLGEPFSGRDRSVLTELPGHLFSLRLRNWKLIQRGSPQTPHWKLFDRETDPLERMNLAAELPDTLALLQGYLEGLVAQYGAAELSGITTTADPALIERLRTLGYIK